MLRILVNFIINLWVSRSSNLEVILSFYHELLRIALISISNKNTNQSSVSYLYTTMPQHMHKQQKIAASILVGE